MTSNYCEIEKIPRSLTMLAGHSTVNIENKFPTLSSEIFFIFFAVSLCSYERFLALSFLAISVSGVWNHLLVQLLWNAYPLCALNISKGFTYPSERIPRVSPSPRHLSHMNTSAKMTLVFEGTFGLFKKTNLSPALAQIQGTQTIVLLKTTHKNITTEVV